ncbi:Hypothetical predicted protein [Lecanosticta acicola]|uniref:Uncharacterized protein n=1 Tax=Lecanosticta acicola TaxID=111012 RepID=A0AAI8Z155_9PEZI|nr:Hypothetical predicted protein [Lecanosticta acicola]
MNSLSSREAIRERTRNALKLSVPAARIPKDEYDHMASWTSFSKHTGSVMEWWTATPGELPPLKFVKNDEDDESDGDVPPLVLSRPVEIPATPTPPPPLPVSETLSSQLQSPESSTLSSAMTTFFTPTTRTPSTAQTTTPASSHSKRTEIESQAKSGPDSIRQVRYTSQG